MEAVEQSVYLIHVGTGDPVSGVALGAGSALKAVPGVGAPHAAETRVGITAAHWGCRGCRGYHGHQGVGGWRLKAERA